MQIPVEICIKDVAMFRAISVHALSFDTDTCTASAYFLHWEIHFRLGLAQSSFSYSESAMALNLGP